MNPPPFPDDHEQHHDYDTLAGLSRRVVRLEGEVKSLREDVDVMGPEVDDFKIKKATGRGIWWTISTLAGGAGIALAYVYYEYIQPLLAGAPRQ